MTVPLRIETSRRESPGSSKPALGARRPRSGSMLLEATAGLFIMVVVCTLIAQLAVLANRQWERCVRRRECVQAAANLIDEITAAPWQALNAENAEAWQLPPLLLQQLPGGRLHVSVADFADSLPAKQITVEISWNDRSGELSHKVRLVSWRYAAAEESSR